MLIFGIPAAFIHSLLGPFYFSTMTTPIHRTKLIHTNLLLFSLSCAFFLSENPHQSCYRANGRNENRPENDVNCTSGLPSGFQTVQSDTPEFTDQYDTDFLAFPKFCFFFYFSSGILTRFHQLPHHPRRQHRHSVLFFLATSGRIQTRVDFSTFFLLCILIFKISHLSLYFPFDIATRLPETHQPLRLRPNVFFS